MVTYARDVWGVLAGAHRPTLFMGFFAYVWLLWTAKALMARRYRPSTASPEGLRTSVVVPVFNEPGA